MCYGAVADKNMSVARVVIGVIDTRGGSGIRALSEGATQAARGKLIPIIVRTYADDEGSLSFLLASTCRAPRAA